MGIDFSHCDAHWSYSGFHRFRERIAGDAGINLNDMEGFGGAKTWDALRVQELQPFLYHSDCDGELSVEEMRRVEPVLRQFVEQLTDDYDRTHGLELCKGMREAIRRNEPLEFS